MRDATVLHERPQNLCLDLGVGLPAETVYPALKFKMTLSMVLTGL